MKNVGMAGAVALVGIGLITLGLGQFDRLSTAATSIDGDQRAFAFPRGSTCSTTILEDQIIVIKSECDFDQSAKADSGEGRLVLMADVMGLGYEQMIKLPWRDGVGVYYPLEVFGRDFVWTLDFNPLTLDFGDWKGGYTRLIGLIDMDADGRLDLVLTQSRVGERRIGYLRNIAEIAPRLPADLNDDGRVDGADLGELFVQWTG